MRPARVSPDPRSAGEARAVPARRIAPARSRGPSGRELSRSPIVPVQDAVIRFECAAKRPRSPDPSTGRRRRPPTAPSRGSPSRPPAPPPGRDATAVAPAGSVSAVGLRGGRRRGGIGDRCERPPALPGAQGGLSRAGPGRGEGVVARVEARDGARRTLCAGRAARTRGTPRPRGRQVARTTISAARGPPPASARPRTTGRPRPARPAASDVARPVALRPRRRSRAVGGGYSRRRIPSTRTSAQRSLRKSARRRSRS